jgi:glycosidase
MTLRSYFQPSFLLLFIRRWGLFILTLLGIAIVLGIGTSKASACAEPCTIVNESTNPPEQLGPGYRFIVSANTDFGEGVMVELHYGATYIRYDCEYLNGSGLPPGTTARYKCETDQDIAEGTNVEYQYAICDYGTTGTNCHSYTGFIYSFTAPAPPSPPTSCDGAIVGDSDIYWVGLGHNSFDAYYRNPTGPVTTSQGTVNLKLRTCENDASAVNVRIWNDLDNVETILPMTEVITATDPTIGNVSYWSVNVTIPTTSTILYYVFRVIDNTTVYYRALNSNEFYGGLTVPGGWGEPTWTQSEAEGPDGFSYQLTVYDPAYSVPTWMQTGIVYQIFPDRFRDGNPANNPAPGRFFYDEHRAILRSTDPDWNTTICDPRSNSSPCPGIYGQNFYGGDLAGITQKINQGYFDNLGVNVLYLNPIFRSPSNHKYDTADYKVIDPDFGTLAHFQAMATAAHDHGIKIMLDGVFNHTASDSKYFDRYSRYDVAGNLTSPNGPGSNDGSGACEATSSTFRNWFYFSDMFTISNPGRDLPTNTLALCAPVNPPNETRYEAWYGYSSLPKLQANSAQVRDLIWSDGENSVGPYWTQQGADGWRFDVGADVDQGRTNPGNNDYWEGFRAAVRDSNVTGKTDVVMLGEEWGDSSPWLLGNEWDSVMNYRFRSALLSWLFTGCVDGSNGCSSDARGEKFEENDSNNFSSSGPIGYLSPSQLDARLRTIQEDYPPMSFKAMMNLEGSHDTQRLRFLLKKGNNDDDTAAIQRMKEWWLFSYTYAGAPTLYYGDEMGLNQDGVWDGSNWQDDPYNRLPFAWNDTPGDYTADTNNLLPHARNMSSIRLSYQALQDGDVQHGLIVDDANKLYGFARTNADMTALVDLNRDNATHTANFTGLNAAPYNLPDGTVLRDVMTVMTGTTGVTYTVSGGAVSVPVNSNWGVVLLEESEIDTPTAAVVSGTRSGNDIVLSWSPVVTDTEGGQELATVYEIYRGTTPLFVPDNGSKLADIAPPPFGTSDGKVSYTDPNPVGGVHFYVVRACNAAGNCSDSDPVFVPAGNTDTPTPTPTETQTSTSTATLTATETAISTSTATETAIPSSTATQTATETTTATSTATETAIPTSTATLTATETAIVTSTNTSTATSIATGTANATATATRTATTIATGTGTSTGTAAATGTSTSTSTRTATAMATSTSTRTATAMATSTSTGTKTATAIATSTTIAEATATTTSTACPIQFQDVPPSNQVSSFYPYVRCLACRGVLGGYPCGGTNPQTGETELCGASGDPYFRPSNNITRGQIAKIVSNAAGFDEEVEGQTYADVMPSDEPSSFYVYVERLTAHNVMSGYPCGMAPKEECDGQNRAFFRPGANATRAQLSKIVSNAAGFVDTVEGQTFTDVPPSTEPSSFYIYVERLARRGVISGYPCGGPAEQCDDQDRPYFRPGNPVTRAQAAKIVANTFYPNCQTPARP